MKRIAVLALALVMMLGALVACGNDIHAKSEGVMTHAEYIAAAKDAEVTRMHLVRDRPSPLGVTADDVWCRDAPVTPGLPGWKVAPRPLSPSPVALVRSFSPPPHPPPPSPPLPPLATPHVFRGGLLGACFSLVPLCSRCLVW